MTEKETLSIFSDFKKDLKIDFVKDFYITDLINSKTLIKIGFILNIVMNRKYDYTETFLNRLKYELNARTFFISTRDNKLVLSFKIYYNDLLKEKLKRKMKIKFFITGIIIGIILARIYVR